MSSIDHFKKLYPDKFSDEEVIFSHIRRGDHIFVSSGCGEPQYLDPGLGSLCGKSSQSLFRYGDYQRLLLWHRPLYGPEVQA